MKKGCLLSSMSPHVFRVVWYCHVCITMVHDKVCTNTNLIIWSTAFIISVTFRTIAGVWLCLNSLLQRPLGEWRIPISEMTADNQTEVIFTTFYFKDSKLLPSSLMHTKNYCHYNAFVSSSKLLLFMYYVSFNFVVRPSVRAQCENHEFRNVSFHHVTLTSLLSVMLCLLPTTTHTTYQSKYKGHCQSTGNAQM